jgi:hypothetical protein
VTRRTMLHRIAEALRAAEPDHVPAEPVETERDPEPLPPGQRRVKVSFDEVLAARGYSYPYMRWRIAPASDVERARRAAEAAMGRAGQDVLWPD